MAINESLGLDDADLIQQLAAIEKKNELLELSQIETQQTLKLLEKVNADLVLKDEALQNLTKEKIGKKSAQTNEPPANVWFKGNRKLKSKVQ